MIQGTASNVGKSIVTAALCRLFYRWGYRVAPFKAQNMANNSFVTMTGEELGRAQASQAKACGIEPSALMNPVLLKPETNQRAQIICLGKYDGHTSRLGTAGYSKKYKPVVTGALDELRRQFEIIVIEGAGSPVEMNLKKHDIVNMSIAKHAQSSVILVGDIDWGGIFAQLVGTYSLLEPSEKKLVKAFLINKFRGRRELLDDGLSWLQRRTQKKILGVIPFVSDFDIEEEDSISTREANLSGLRANRIFDGLSGNRRDRRIFKKSRDQLLIDIIWYPRISNFTDFDGLKRERDVVLRYLHEPDPHHLPDLLILPGSKNTLADLKFVVKTGLGQYIQRCFYAGVPVLGICGGFQMLGERIDDPKKIESEERGMVGLKLLPVVTTYRHEKTTCRVRAVDLTSGCSLSGYEIHMGASRKLKRLPPLFSILERNGKPSREEEGVLLKGRSKTKATWVGGTYLHGIFDSPEFTRAFLDRIRLKKGLKPLSLCREEVDHYDYLADLFEKHIDTKFLRSLII